MLFVPRITRNLLFGQNADYRFLKQVVHVVTTGFYSVNVELELQVKLRL
jgi:hypothetical protein